jgi:hypothetical protein
VDETSAMLLRLADPSVRGGLLDEEALLAVASVCYDIDASAVTGPTTAVYDRFDVAVPVTSEVVAAARLSKATEPVPWEITASLDGLVAPTPGADAVWAGSVVVRAAGGAGTIEEVKTSAPDLDAAFAAALAGLPPTATRQEVQAALRQAAKAGFATPLTDTELDALLAVVAPGVADPRALGRAAGGRDLAETRLGISEPPDQSTAPPVALPVVVAFLVADAAAPPRQLLQSTAFARRAARPYPVPAAPAGSPSRKVERCVCWVLPAAAFEDDGWPGGAGGSPAQQRAARLAAARAWLATQGVAVVTT